MVNRMFRGYGCALALPLLVFCLAKTSRAQTAVTTWHYDNARSGANTSETILTPSNVNWNHFGKLFTQPVDGAIIGQALYLPNVTIPNLGTHNVVYVATMNDSVYAFDADSAAGQNALPLWYTSFLSPGVIPVPIDLQGCGGTTKWTEVGVVSTPVIDPVSGTLYVVAKTYENSNFVYRLHALDVTTGTEKQGSPVVISATFQFNGTEYDFDASTQVNRPALLLDNGTLYIAMGSNGCRGREQGWVIAYNSSSLQEVGAFDDEPGIAGAGIWQKGGGPSADSAHNVFVETADGPFVSGTSFGESVLELSPVTLTLADWFTPFNQKYLTHSDLDLNASPLVLPDQSGPYPHLALAVGKEGTIYVLNRDKMGHFCANCKKQDTQIVEECRQLAGKETGNLVYWNNQLYATPVNGPISVFSVINGQILKKALAQSSIRAGGHSPVLSSNGTSDGILWQTGSKNLLAFDANTLTLLYSTSQAPHARDQLPSVPHFANVMVVNGKVYVGGDSSLVAFGPM